MRGRVGCLDLGVSPGSLCKSAQASQTVSIGEDWSLTRSQGEL